MRVILILTTTKTTKYSLQKSNGRKKEAAKLVITNGINDKLFSLRNDGDEPFGMLPIPDHARRLVERLKIAAKNLVENRKDTKYRQEYGKLHKQFEIAPPGWTHDAECQYFVPPNKNKPIPDLMHLGGLSGVMTTNETPTFEEGIHAVIANKISISKDERFINLRDTAMHNHYHMTIKTNTLILISRRETM